METLFKDRRELREFVKDHVMTTHEAIDLLEVSYSKFYEMIKSGQISPIKQKKGAVSLFLKTDLVELKFWLEKMKREPRMQKKSKMERLIQGYVQKANQSPLKERR